MGPSDNSGHAESAGTDSCGWVDVATTDMKIAILGNPQSWYVRTLTDAATRGGHAAEAFDFCRLSSAILEPRTRTSQSGTSLDSSDAVLVRTMPPGSLEQVVFRMDVLHRCEAQGLLVVNPPRAIECAVDKYLASARMAAAGLPTPRTIVCETTEDAMRAFEHLSRDVVVKPLFGAEGRGIVRVSDEELAWRVCTALERTRSVLYIQEFLEHDGSDRRLVVLGDRVLGAMERRNPNDFRTNISRKATASSVDASVEECDLALSAARAVGACFAGVDLLRDQQGRWHVIEVNGVPGWRAFERVTRIPVADELIRYLERQLT